MTLKVTLISNQVRVFQAIDRAENKRIFEVMTFLRTKVLQKLSGPRTGKQYRKPNTQKVYTASAPGEAPARPTGELARSIKKRIKRTLLRGIEGIIGSPLKKAPALEFGTRTIRPRPFLRPVFKENLRKIKAMLGRKWF